MLNVRSRWLVAAFAFALLPACGKSDKAAQQSATASTTPAKTVLTSIELLKNGQFDPLLQHVLPPADYKEMRAQWTAQHSKMKQISEHDRQQFAENMAKLTAPDAEQKIWAETQPKLQQLDKKYKTQLPMMIGVGQIMLDTQISNAKNLTPDQKKQATDVVSALGQWAQKVPWTDPDKLKQAIGVLTSTARKLDIKTLDQATSMGYDESMKKYGVVWGGVKKALKVYGLSLDKTLDSAKAKTLTSDAHTATVKVDYTLLGQPQSMTLDLVKVDDRWYDKDLLDHWRKALDRHAPAAASSTATAGNAPAALPADSASSAK
ncbi:hypothetical protein GCM10027285_00200 [Oleiagrimonas citrea]|uniref:Uncharacterized protein n=1 Tax=Oleiagrimonas citrea TaxID=1665687 RepID=A0A846ZQR7_9GAMM|nr:hypothetical protein [Oleiagrimonas citrea]NKZ39771.1 hypothetical protein [Oleiagrimonas citrea]